MEIRNNMTVEQLFGTLQQAIVGSWRKHLRTAKYAKHEALDEFYKEMPEKVDALIEAWMGANGKKIGKFENMLDSANYNTLKYLGELKQVCKQGYAVLGDNEELKSLLDDIVNLINSTLYKVKELNENKQHTMKNLKDFINEALITEARTANITVGKFIEDCSGYWFSAKNAPSEKELIDNFDEPDYTDWSFDGKPSDEVAEEFAKFIIDNYKTKVKVTKEKHKKYDDVMVWSFELDGHTVKCEFQAA